MLYYVKLQSDVLQFVVHEVRQKKASDSYLPSQFYIHPDGFKKQICQFDTSNKLRHPQKNLALLFSYSHHLFMREKLNPDKHSLIISFLF